MWTSGCTKMDHPANPECQNVGAPIGVRIMVKKTGRIPYKMGVERYGPQISWLVFLNQKILCHVFHAHFCSRFFTPKIKQRSKERVESQTAKTGFLFWLTKTRQRRLTTTSAFYLLLGSLVIESSLRPEMQEAHKGCLERKMTLKFWVNFAWRCVNFIHLIFKLWVGRCSLAKGPTLLVDHFACWGNFPHW